MSRLAKIALLVALAAAATVGGAWLFQLAGYSPCELCLKQRVPYYVGVPLAVPAKVAEPAPPAIATEVQSVPASEPSSQLRISR